MSSEMIRFAERIRPELINELRLLQNYAHPQSMDQYVAWSRKTREQIVIGMAPDEAPLYHFRGTGDLLFYGESGERALQNVASGELLRLHDLPDQRVCIMTTRPQEWVSIIRKYRPNKHQMQLFDIRKHDQRAQAALVLTGGAQTDFSEVENKPVTYFLDQIHACFAYEDFCDAFALRAWRTDKHNNTILASTNEPQSIMDNSDFYRVLPVNEDLDTEIFGLIYTPACQNTNVHLVRIFSESMF